MKGDPRAGDMNYLDWLMNVLSPDEATPDNIDDIIEYNRRDRAQYQLTGKAPKKNTESKGIDLERLGLISKPAPMKRRKL